MRLEGKMVSIYGKEGVETYEGAITPEGSVAVRAMVTPYQQPEDIRHVLAGNGSGL